MRQRPEIFSINYHHSLARDLVVAYLGNYAGSTRCIDSSIRLRDGLITGANWYPGFSYGALNRICLNFDGSDDKVNLDASHVNANMVTISFWIYDREGASGQGDMFQLGGNGFAFWRNNTAWWSGRQGTASSNWAQMTAVDNKWTHILCEYNEYPTLRVNNAVYTAVSPLPLVTNSASAMLANGTDGYQNSALADFMVWNRILQSQEIQILKDPSNPMLSGMLEPPKRQFYTTGISSARQYHLIFKYSNKYLKFGVRV